MALHGDTATALVCPCVKSQKKRTVLVGFHEKRSELYRRHEELRNPAQACQRSVGAARELINSLSLRKKLPQIELAVTDEALALVLCLGKTDCRR